MKYDLTKGTGNYEVKVVVDAKTQEEMKEGALKLAQKDFTFQGFRQGHVPLSIVEQNIKPEYMQMAMYEEVINKALQKVVKENEKIQFIGQPYDLQDTKDEKGWTITFKLDVYPEVEVKDNKRESLHVHAIEATATAEEKENAFTNLRRQYADYQDADTISEDSVAKIKFIMKDKDGNEIDKGTAFVGKEEFDEFALVKKEFVGQKKDATVEFAYDEKKLPHILHFHPKDEAKKDEKAATVSATIVDVKNVILPDFTNEETLKKLFGNEEISSESALKAKIDDVLNQQKKENELHKAVEHVIEQASASMSVTIPQTIMREEMAARIKQLGDRMGGEAGMKQYFDQIGEEGTKKVYDDIETSARLSLEKFFMLRKLTELLGIDNIDRNKHLDAEEKIYEKLLAGGGKSKAKHTHEDEEDKPKKTTSKAKKDGETTDEKPKKTAARKKKEE